MSQQDIGLACDQITEADLTWWLQKIPTLDWVFVVTYARRASRICGWGRTHGLASEDCARAAHVIRTFGELAKFLRETRTYLVGDQGCKYWGMAGDQLAESNLINRARAEHDYGVQNAPRTRTETFSSYDAVATHWNAAYCSDDQERHAI